MSAVGHNSVAADQLRGYVERIERLEDEKRAATEDIKDICVEAKSQGYDAKTIRRIVALRRLDAAKRKEAQELLDLYAHALGLDLV